MATPLPTTYSPSSWDNEARGPPSQHAAMALPQWVNPMTWGLVIFW